MKIISLQAGQACCEAAGVRRQVDTYLLADQQLCVGDYLLVHVGYAIQKLQLDDAEETLSLIASIEPSQHA